MPRKRQAEESYEQFHEAKPKGWRKTTIPALPKKAWKLGRLIALVYEPEEPSARAGEAYEHAFGDRGYPGGTLFFDKEKPLLFVSEDNQQLVIVRGKSKYYIDPNRGIIA